VTSGVTSSGADPHGVATTGVPQASASTITSPNGSGHARGFRRQLASASSASLSRAPTSPTYSTSPPEQRSNGLVEVRQLRGLAHLRCDLQREADRSGDTGRDVHTLVRIHAAEEQRVAATSVADRVGVDVETMVDRGGNRRLVRGGRMMP
jgi:hypothetical protein